MKGLLGPVLALDLEGFERFDCVIHAFVCILRTIVHYDGELNF